LSIGLAQKLAIRLNKTFWDAVLLKLNAATLLSQYFGQSAAKIHSIFEALAAQSVDTPMTLTVLLIDEIESLAASRETANARNEVHDAIRATNALLTGFDMVKNNANVLIICTSNMSDSLDAAFIDRCGRHIKVPQPDLAARYEILRNSLNSLVEREVIKAPIAPLPTFRQAEYGVATDSETAGWALRCLAYRLEDNGPDGPVVSARWLSQLAEIALANELEPNALCTVVDAVKLMSQYVKVVSGQKRPKRSQDAAATECDSSVAKKPKFQLTEGSSNMLTDSHLFGGVPSADLEDLADECIATFSEMEGKKGYKPSPDDIDMIEGSVLDRWENYGGCCCGSVIGSRLRDYIEHGTPMDRDDSH
jgi:MoxR-like ATPase